MYIWWHIFLFLLCVYCKETNLSSSGNPIEFPSRLSIMVSNGIRIFYTVNTGINGISNFSRHTWISVLAVNREICHNFWRYTVMPLETLLSTSGFNKKRNIIHTGLLHNKEGGGVKTQKKLFCVENCGGSFDGSLWQNVMYRVRLKSFLC